MNDGGQAFPSVQITHDKHETYTHSEEGMTLRDYFAAKALQGNLAANSDTGHPLAMSEMATRHLVIACWRLADLMIAERSK